MNQEKMKQASDLILQARALIKEEWDIDQTDDRAFGCYKALNAVHQALTEKDESGKGPSANSGFYILSRLVEAEWNLANHFKYDMRNVVMMVEAMVNSR